jgi:hypothetical protein
MSSFCESAPTIVVSRNDEFKRKPSAPALP